jgi:hypothetical protein
MSYRYSHIAIIFNPNSSKGKAEGRAKRLYNLLKEEGLPNIEVIATEYAGHAEELAYAIASKYKQPLIISVSGDGGYNEVINGALRAQDEDKSNKPVCAILAAGNANDHRRSVRLQPLSQAILNDKPEPIDILRLKTSEAGENITRYAHSYIGFGFTGKIADRLNKIGTHNLFRETLLTRFSYVKVLNEKGKRRNYDNLICAKLHQMSKVYRMGRRTNLHDGQFRLISFRHRPRILFILHLFMTLIHGFKRPKFVSRLSFTLLKSEWAHCDGEVIKIPGGSKVLVTCEPEKMLTLR